MTAEWMAVIVSVLIIPMFGIIAWFGNRAVKGFDGSVKGLTASVYSTQSQVRDLGEKMTAAVLDHGERIVALETKSDAHEKEQTRLDAEVNKLRDKAA